MTVKTNIGNIIGSEDTLNLIANAFIEASHSFEKCELNGFATDYREAWNTIHNELIKSGYYK